MSDPYADNAHAYLLGGWHPFPLPYGKKIPPPPGFTGYTAVPVTRKHVDAWIAKATASQNIGLHLPEHVLGIDVDHYGDKTGAYTLGDYEEKLGTLPDTWVSSSRDGLSGIRFYRVPAGRMWVGQLAHQGSVDIISHHERFAVIWPSAHPEGGTYAWTDPDGFPSNDTPSVDVLPELPAAWVAHLDKGPLSDRDLKADLHQSEAWQWLEHSTLQGDPCRWLRRVIADAAVDLRTGNDHHGAIRGPVMTVVRAGEQGHVGALAALEQLRDIFEDSLAGHRSWDEHEWVRLVVGAVATCTVEDQRTDFEDRGCCPEDPPEDVDLADVLADEGTPDKEKGETWGRVDLTGIIDDIISGAYQPPMPSVGQFGDRALFYKDAVNSVAGPPSSGKTWVVLVAARQEMEAGRDVVYIDMENGVGPFISRLINDMGVDAGLIKDRLVYIFPEEKLGDESGQFLKEALRGVRPTLIALDTTGVSMALEHTAPNDDDAVARWFKRIPSALARRTGAAVVLIDHVPKNSENDTPIGSQRKMAAVDAQYMLRNGTRFSRTADGLADVVCSKDRHGRFTPGDTICRLSMRHVDDQLEALLVDVSNTEDVAGLSAMEQHVLQRIQEHYDENHGHMDENDEEIDARPNITMVRSLCTGNNAAIKAAVEALVARGLLLSEVLASKTPGRNPVVYTPLAPDFEIEE